MGTSDTTIRKQSYSGALVASVVALAIATGALISNPIANATPTSKPMNTYLGTTHAHTGADNDHSAHSNATAADTFEAAKNSGFDFLFLTEHSGTTGPSDPVAYNAEAQAAADLFSENNVFAGNVGYEYSDNNQGTDDDPDKGHLTGFGTTMPVDAHAPGMDFAAFYNELKLAKQQDPLVFAGFNHPSGDHQAAAAQYLNSPDKWSVALTETSNGNNYVAVKEAAYYDAYVTFLDRGWYVSPTCGLDNHGTSGLTRPESVNNNNFKPCRTGILAPTLNRDSVVWSILNRRTYSTRDSNLDIQYSLNNNWMGSRIDRVYTANLDINVNDPDTYATDKINKIEVIGDGGVVLASKDFDSNSVSWQPNLPIGTHNYMFLKVYNNERTEHTAVTAPVWFK